MKIQFLLNENLLDDYSNNERILWNQIFLNDYQFMKYMIDETSAFRLNTGKSLDEIIDSFEETMLFAVSSFDDIEDKQNLLYWIKNGILNGKIQGHEYGIHNNSSFLKACLDSFVKYEERLAQNGHSVDIWDYNKCDEINRIIIPFVLEDLRAQTNDLKASSDKIRKEQEQRSQNLEKNRIEQDEQKKRQNQNIYDAFGFSPEEIKKLTQ